MFLNWIYDNYLEVLGAITGLIYLYFSINQLIWLWPLGIITSFLYIFVFFQAKFYADMSLQFYYLIVSFYGWYHWIKGRKVNVDDGIEKLPVIRAKVKTIALLILITFILSFVAGYFLDNNTDSPIPYWDAFTTSGSIVATWMLARKMIENWIFWVVIDFVALGTYLYKGLFATAVLFLVYTFMAVIGFYKWKKSLKV
jgi:nicotinamide mononucleotide transporter